MKKIYIFYIFFVSTLFAQQKNSSDIINIYSPSNIKKFADYLFCQRDYLRAIEQYQKYLSSVQNDTLDFKIGLAYSYMGEYNKAADQFYATRKSSPFISLAGLEYYKALFQDEDYSDFRKIYNNSNLNSNYKYFNNVKKLYYYTYFFTDDKLPDKNEFLNSFMKQENLEAKKFYSWKANPPYKNPFTAAVLSTIIPGLGKIYAEQYSDGIVAALAVGALGYISYTDFHAGHKFRAWLFTALTAGFYAGNIYGSYAAVQIYNVKINFDFVRDVKHYLETKNFFTPIINFCK